MTVLATVLYLLVGMAIAVVVVLQLRRTVCADQAWHELVRGVPALSCGPKCTRVAFQGRYLSLNIWSGVLADDTVRARLVVAAELGCVPSQIDHLVMLELRVNVLSTRLGSAHVQLAHSLVVETLSVYLDSISCVLLLRLNGAVSLRVANAASVRYLIESLLLLFLILAYAFVRTFSI